MESQVLMADNSTAFLGSIIFPYNPNSFNYSYQLNKVSFDTIGGRVTQLLSIKINTITWEGDAGSRQKLLYLFRDFKQIQDQQVDKEQSTLLTVPSRDWKMTVWARSMEIGWDYQSVTYPYRIQFEVDEDFGGILSGVTSPEIDALVNNSIGWSKNYSGLPGGTLLVDTSAEAALTAGGV